MNERIDVLAVIDELIQEAENTDEFGFIPRPEAHQARAAIAELIEASQKVSDGANGRGEVSVQEMQRRLIRFRAALARVQGGAE